MKRPIYSALVVQRHDNSVLIVKSVEQNGTGEATWLFPRTAVAQGESPEAAVRRLANAEFGLVVEVDVVQPPLVGEVEGREAEFRYMFCGICSDASRDADASSVRWVPVGNLADYRFASPCCDVAAWMAQQR